MNEGMSDSIAAVGAQARQDVKMNEATLERIRKFKSSEGVWKC